jgi:membrane-bound lytic murein transglycosylase D
MENPRHYGFHLPAEHIYPPRWYDTVQVEISQRLKLTDLALALDVDFKALKELNPQFLRDYVPRGNYKIKVPPGLGAKVVVSLQKLGKGGDRQKEYISENHYLVREGDTLGRIAMRTGVSLETLKRINRIEGSTIWAGQKLRLTD